MKQITVTEQPREFTGQRFTTREGVTHLDFECAHPVTKLIEYISDHMGFNGAEQSFGTYTVCADPDCGEQIDEGF